MLNTRRVIHVAQYLVTESGLKALATLVEELELLGRERIELVAVAAYEMAEHRTGNNGLLMLQAVNQLIHILLRIKT